MISSPARRISRLIIRTGPADSWRDLWKKYRRAVLFRIRPNGLSGRRRGLTEFEKYLSSSPFFSGALAKIIGAHTLLLHSWQTKSKGDDMSDETNYVTTHRGKKEINNAHVSKGRT